ncbi:hypothetical protein ACS0TY_001366 [Phlomoides rotata]
MATSSSSSTSITSLLLNSHNSYNLKPPLNEPHCSFLRPTNFHGVSAARKSSTTDLVVRRATPELAGDVLSSLPLDSLNSIPGFSLVADNPLLTAAAGLFVGLPLMIQRLVALTKEMDMAAQTVEKIADCVEKVAEGVDKAAEDLAKALPEGELKKVVHFVEELAEETARDAQKVEDLMDKVEELDDKLEEFLDKQFKGTGKA